MQKLFDPFGGQLVADSQGKSDSSEDPLTSAL